MSNSRDVLITKIRLFPIEKLLERVLNIVV